MSHFFRLFMVLVLVGLVASCGNLNRTPRYDVPEPLTVETFKRRTLHDNQDFIYTWKGDAYSKVTEPIRQRLSPSQTALLERHGQPDYIRKGFKSENGEIVDEWAWWDRSIIAQFVQRELVFEGPLTDMDRARIRYGYPRRAWSQKEPTGVTRDLWEYQNLPVETTGMVMTFSDEKLVSENRF